VVSDLRSTLAERESLEAELERRALHDPLNGLANRTLFADRLDHALAQRDQRVAVLFLDLDDFKTVNDTHGHHAGDELLIAVAARLTGLLGPGDVAARLGGDEFAVLLPGAGESRAREIANRVEAALSEPLTVAGERLRVGVSVGAATGSPHDAARLLSEADAAMYVRKHSLTPR
jgi:diguanylate cyclase (GGDEF)-like protein